MKVDTKRNVRVNILQFRYGTTDAVTSRRVYCPIQTVLSDGIFKKIDGLGEVRTLKFILSLYK